METSGPTKVLKSGVDECVDVGDDKIEFDADSNSQPSNVSELCERELGVPTAVDDIDDDWVLTYRLLAIGRHILRFFNTGGDCSGYVVSSTFSPSLKSSIR